jgi:membrane-bound lytic murein transglycosylase D
MRILAKISAGLALLVSVGAGAAGNSSTELERAIANLAGRSGPSLAHVDDNAVLPPGLLQQSLWQRLRTRFEFTGIEHADIDAQISYFQSGLTSLRSNLATAQPFLYFIVDEIDRAGLPLDLALLPLIESAYNPHARSGKNAVGVWQFIPATAKTFDLSISANYDGRKDVVDSTRAAITYLKKLNDTFDGDWLLALAAYNTGPTNVRSAITRARNAGKDPVFWNLELPRETRNYVPRIIAATRVIGSPAQYGLELPPIANRKAIDTIAVGRPLSFAAIADIIGGQVSDLERLNPGHIEKAIPKGGPYHITLPALSADALIMALRDDKLGPVGTLATPADYALLSDRDLKYRVVPDAYLPRSSQRLPFKPYKKYVYESHTVTRGESLWKVSRGLDTDVETLLDWSGRSDKPIQPGDELIVAYIGRESDGDVRQHLLNYRVLPGETLVSISRKFELSISDLKKWNPSLWKKNHLQAGQAIKIPVTTSSDL